MKTPILAVAVILASFAAKADETGRFNPEPLSVEGSVFEFLGGLPPLNDCRCDQWVRANVRNWQIAEFQRQQLILQLRKDAWQVCLGPYKDDIRGRDRCIAEYLAPYSAPKQR